MACEGPGAGSGRSFTGEVVGGSPRTGPAAVEGGSREMLRRSESQDDSSGGPGTSFDPYSRAVLPGWKQGSGGLLEHGDEHGGEERRQRRR